MSRVQNYLPSRRFAGIVGAAALSGALIFAAQELTKPEAPYAGSSIVVAAQDRQDWQAMLRDIQSQSATYSLPPAPDQNAVQNLLSAAQTPNLTDTVGRSLFIGLSNAKSQGLGDDIPTQEKLVAGVAQQISQNGGAPAYAAGSLQTVESSQTTLKTYGNSFMTVVGEHQAANYYQALLDIGNATDNQDASRLAALKPIGEAYGDLAKALASMPVPQTLAPLHLQIVNNFARMAQLFPDMQLLLSDPLKGLAALQAYESLMDETGRVFTNVAQQLRSNGILFTKDEPGGAWSALLP